MQGVDVEQAGLRAERQVLPVGHARDRWPDGDALRPISVGHAQSPTELYTGKNVDLYIVSLYQRPR
jgi:hypothetical protein